MNIIDIDVTQAMRQLAKQLVENNDLLSSGANNLLLNVSINDKKMMECSALAANCKSTDWTERLGLKYEYSLNSNLSHAGQKDGQYKDCNLKLFINSQTHAIWLPRWNKPEAAEDLKYIVRFAIPDCSTVYSGPSNITVMAKNVFTGEEEDRQRLADLLKCFSTNELGRYLNYVGNQLSYEMKESIREQRDKYDPSREVQPYIIPANILAECNTALPELPWSTVLALFPTDDTAGCITEGTVLLGTVKGVIFKQDYIINPDNSLKTLLPYTIKDDGMQINGERGAFKLERWRTLGHPAKLEKCRSYITSANIGRPNSLLDD